MKPADVIPFHRPSIGGSERQAVLDVLESGWLTTGSRAQEFEQRFGAFVGSKHAVAVNSATAALHLALEGIGVREDDEVIIPTYTFAAAGETVLYRRARPVLVDVAADALGADPAAVGAAVTERTKAVEVVHIGGLPADLAGIQASVQEAARGLGIAAPPLVEDAAHAFPSPMPSSDGRFAGTVGRAGAFSFYATKTITTGEGGMLVTDDDDLAARARTMRLHGISHDAWKRYSAAGNWFYEITAAGFKDNLTDLAAALGIAQLERAGELRRARVSIADRYLAGLSGRDQPPDLAGHERRAGGSSHRGRLRRQLTARVNIPTACRTGRPTCRRGTAGPAPPCATSRADTARAGLAMPRSAPSQGGSGRTSRHR